MASSIINDFIQSLSIFVQSGLFIDELKHGLVSFVFASIFYYKTKSLKYSALIILITYLIDSDHLVDYFLYYGAQFSFAEFIRLRYFEITRRAVVPFHAWEWVIFLGLLATQQVNKNKRILLAAIAVGIVSHLTWDLVTVDSFWFYSISYRISQSFIVIN